MTVTLNIYLLFNNSAYANGESANFEFKSEHSFFSGSNSILEWGVGFVLEIDQNLVRIDILIKLIL